MQGEGAAEEGMPSSLGYSSCFLALLISEAVPPLIER